MSRARSSSAPTGLPALYGHQLGRQIAEDLGQPGKERRARADGPLLHAGDDGQRDAGLSRQVALGQATPESQLAKAAHVAGACSSISSSGVTPRASASFLSVESVRSPRPIRVSVMIADATPEARASSLPEIARAAMSSV